MEKESKYIKKKGEKTESKYIRSKDDEPVKSQYLKSENDEKMSGRERYEQYLEREKEQLAELEEGENAPEEELAEVIEPEEENEAQASVFKGREKKSETDRISTGSSENSKNLHNKIILRMITCWLALTALSIVLQLLRFRLPLMPYPFKMDLSSLPELLAAVAYGPIAGMGVTVVKNVAYFLIAGKAAAATCINNTILDSVFVMVSSLLYTRGMFSPEAIKRDKEKLSGDRRMKQILFGGFVGSFITAIVSFFTVYYIVIMSVVKKYGASYPYYSYDAFLTRYRNAYSSLNGYLHGIPARIIPEIYSVKWGVLIYNVPLTFIKLLFVTAVTALIYKWLSPFFHYRNKK